MRLLKIVLLLMVLAVVVAVAALWRLPADVAYRYAGQRLGPVALGGLRGTFWDGHADSVSVLGRDLGELDWHARKAPLLTGRFVADVRIKGADIDAAGLLTREGAGVLVARDLRFSFPAALLAPSLDARRATLLGIVSGVVAQARVAGTLASDLTGTARWSEAGITTPDGEFRFSDVLTDFSSQPDGSIAGTAHDDGRGNLAIDGRFTLTVGTYDAQALLKARNDDAQLADTLRFIGDPQPDGSSRVAARGPWLKVL